MRAADSGCIGIGTIRAAHRDPCNPNECVGDVCGGKVDSWWHKGDGKCDVPGGQDHVTALSAGRWHSLVLKDDGMVVVWGYNVLYQCDVSLNHTDESALSSGECNSRGGPVAA